MNDTVHGAEALAALLNEVRSHFTRDDDLPDNLLPRIDAALAASDSARPTHSTPHDEPLDDGLYAVLRASAKRYENSLGAELNGWLDESRKQLQRVFGNEARAQRDAFNAAIDFAIGQGAEAATFLDAWRHGDTSEWPEFEPSISEVRP